MSDDAARPTPPALRQELGTLEVAEQVFRDLAEKVVSDMGGVASVGRRGGLFRRRSAAQGVQVERGEGEVAFAIHLSVRYDVRIPEMVDDLRQRIKAAVEGATGYAVRTIHVTVEHILPPESPQEPPEEAPNPPPLPTAAPDPGQE